jgi:hypothetical protein
MVAARYAQRRSQTQIKECTMLKTYLGVAAAAAIVLGSALVAAHPAEARDGCSANRYRGPYGSCHRFGTGPYPGGYVGPRPRMAAYGCPPGFWRGPWGHCRDTAYHGRLPGGGWK